MALDQSALIEVLEALRAADVDDRIRQAAQTIYQALIEAELTAVIGAGPNERTESRTGQRNGHRQRVLTTTAGDLELRIPKLAICCVNRCFGWRVGSVRWQLSVLR
jgi:putative transposase